MDLTKFSDRSWTEQEDKDLLDLFSCGLSFRDIAAAFNGSEPYRVTTTDVRARMLQLVAKAER